MQEPECCTYLGWQHHLPTCQAAGGSGSEGTYDAEAFCAVFTMCLWVRAPYTPCIHTSFKLYWCAKGDHCLLQANGSGSPFILESALILEALLAKWGGEWSAFGWETQGAAGIGEWRF